MEILEQKIRNFNGCEVRIDNSVTRFSIKSLVGSFNSNFTSIKGSFAA